MAGAVEFASVGYIEVHRDGVLVSRHRVEREAIQSCIDHARTGGPGTYRIRYPETRVTLRAFGILNPETGQSTDTERPSDVTTLTLLAKGATTVAFSWAAATDNVAVTGYQVFRDGAPIDTTASTNYTDTGRTPSTTYAYTVKAYDAAGNVSLNLSSPLNVTTDANAAPVWSIGQQELTTNTAYNLDLTTVCSDADGNALTFSVVSGSLPSGVTFNAASKQIGGTPTSVETTTYTLRASDGITTADKTITFRALNADTTAPPTPDAPTLSGITSEAITINWSAVTDTEVADARTSGVSGYRVYRDGSLRSTVGNVTTYTDSGLAASTAYEYTVQAFDGAGNSSAQSTAVSGTTTAAPGTVTLIAASDFSYLGYYDLSDNGGGYSRGFTVRRVGSDVRLMNQTWAAENSGPIVEWSLSSKSFGSTITSSDRLNSWSLTGSKVDTGNDRHNSLWWDTAGNRLWYSHSIDYPYDGAPPVFYSNIHIISLTNGASSITGSYKITLDPGDTTQQYINDARTHGGVVAVPASFQSTYGTGPYCVGFGGYVSLRDSRGKASMGLAAYAIPDPAAYAASAPTTQVSHGTPGALIPASAYKILAQRDSEDRGVRKHYGYAFTPNGGTQDGRPSGSFSAINGNPVFGPVSYYDGADYRGENPQYPPTVEPRPGTAPYFFWNGRIQYTTQNWVANDPVTMWNWGDQYVGGFWVEGPTKRGFVQVASVKCGRNYYMGSAGYADQDVAEIHIFDSDQFGEVITGARQKTQIQPKAIYTLTETADSFGSFYFHKYAAAYDEVGKRLYVVANRYEVGPSNVRPFRIYVYAVNV